MAGLQYISCLVKWLSWPVYISGKQRSGLLPLSCEWTDAEECPELFPGGGRAWIQDEYFQFF